MSTHGTITQEPPAPAPSDGARDQSMVRDLPKPERLRRLIGPSVILVGVGVASGEYILFPFIASKAGLVFLWAAVVGVAMQFFINMEIERYTLATGQTALTGFSRLWKPWGLVLVFMGLVATVWPGWATAAATVTTFAVGGGDPNVIAIAGLLAIGVALTSSPVVYQTVERLQLLKVGALLLFVVVALFAAVSGTAYSDASQVVTSFGTFPSEIDLAILVGALAAAGAGGANNLVQSNWIRDKGFGMGRYAPRIVSPITGEEEATESGQRYEFPDDEANMSRWHEWWKRANLEQFVSFALVAAISITVFSLVAYSTVFGNPDLPDESDFSFISLEADVLDDKVGTLVRHAVPGDRRGEPVRRGARHRGLRLPAGGRRDPVRLHRRQLALDREPPLLPDRVDHGDRGQHHPAAGLRPAAGAGDHLHGPGRVHHVRLLQPVGGDQPPLSPAAAQAARVPAGAHGHRDRGPGSDLDHRGRRPDRTAAVSRRFAARLLIALVLWAAFVGVAYAAGLASAPGP